MAITKKHVPTKKLNLSVMYEETTASYFYSNIRPFTELSRRVCFSVLRNVEMWKTV